MKVSLNWIKEYLEAEKIKNLADVNLISENLTQNAFEVEDIEEKTGDFILTVDILPNRAHDSLSHIGIAKEISATSDILFKDKVFAENESGLEGKFSLEVESKDCVRYIGCEIENIAVGPSPKELKEKLESIGERSINNIVDITNVVMFEIGQPMHAFDREKLSGNKIIVRQAKEAEHITTLDNKEVDLNSEVCVIADETDALAIAGIKGGKKPEVDQNTKNIILEAANFNFFNIRKNSRKLGVATESSKRFENHITPVLAEKGINMAIELIKKYASTNETKIYKNIEYYPKPVKDFYSGTTSGEVSALLGREYSDTEVENAFQKLKFEYEIVKPDEKIIESAKNLVGKKYKWGASVSYDAPECFDCSSFVSYLFSRAGIVLPRITIDQFVFGNEITKEEILPGDLVFSINPEVVEHGFHYETKEFLPGTKIPSGVDHVGIYLGDNKIIHATNWNDSGVIIEDLDQSERFKNIVGYRRYYKQGENRFVVKIPHERVDLINTAGKFEMKNIDLAEEVGRIVGYEKIENKEINISGFKPEINKEYYFNNQIRIALSEIGFSEIITYVFVGEGEIMPEKPLAEDKKYLRADLKTGMKNALEHNIKYVDLLNLDRVKTFEIGKVFKKDYTERLLLCLAVKNKTGIKKPKAFEILKEAVSKIEEKLGLNNICNISESDEIIEIDLGELYQKINVPDGANYQKIPELTNIKFKTISNYPFITRDIAVWIPKEQSSDSLLDIIKKHSGDLLVNEPRLFDAFEKEGRVSYAFRMVFQSYEKTLTDEEVNTIMEMIYNDVKSNNNWELR
jgi:phenylalanyl-tRNA synthetase beta subunit